MQGEELFKIKTGHRDDGGSGPEATVHQHLHPIDVEEREHCDEGLVLPHLCSNQGLCDVRHQVVMREHDTLVHTCRTGGVGQGHDGVRLDGHLVGQRFTQPVRQWCRTLNGAADDDDLSDHRVHDGSGGNLNEGSDRDEQGCPGIGQLLVNFTVGVGSVDGGNSPPGQCYAVEYDRVFGDVWRQQGKHVTGLESVGHQTPGKPTHRVMELRVGDDSPTRPVDQGRLIAAGGGC